jgi:hypothetical protein
MAVSLPLCWKVFAVHYMKHYFRQEEVDRIVDQSIEEAQVAARAAACAVTTAKAAAKAVAKAAAQAAARAANRACKSLSLAHDVAKAPKFRREMIDGLHAACERVRQNPDSTEDDQLLGEMLSGTIRYALLEGFRSQDSGVRAQCLLSWRWFDTTEDSDSLRQLIYLQAMKEARQASPLDQRMFFYFATAPTRKRLLALKDVGGVSARVWETFAPPLVRRVEALYNRVRARCEPVTPRVEGVVLRRALKRWSVVTSALHLRFVQNAWDFTSTAHHVVDRMVDGVTCCDLD